MGNYTPHWWIGQVLAAVIAGAVWEQYTPAAGFAVGYTLLLLIDIREKL